MKLKNAALFCTIVLGIFSCTKESVRSDSVSLAPTREPAFVSKHASEAKLEFSHQVELISDKTPETKQLQDQIEKQIRHMFGTMERSEYTAVPKEDHTILITSVEKKAGTNDTYEIFYDYSGTIVLESGPKKYYDVTLPINPDTIYETAKGSGRTNPCTDDHYNSEGDFWYFWSPAPTYKGCRLKQDVDYTIVHGSIERIKKDRKSTYPEYPRLADKSGTIDIHVFFGLDEAQHSHDANRSGDESAKTYRNMRNSLVEMGYNIRQWEPREIAAVYKTPKGATSPFVEDAIKEIPGKNLKMHIRLFYGETGADEKSQPFHYFFRDSLKNGAVVIYDGHSGLGGHLDLASIAELEHFDIAPNKDRYQIFFFNSCTSYTYYNALYFQRKRGLGKDGDAKGTKNLDILANGLSTAFDEMAENDLSLIRAVDNWATRGTWTSYQGLARKIDSDNLFTVNGDEDNPPPPRAAAMNIDSAKGAIQGSAEMKNRVLQCSFTEKNVLIPNEMIDANVELLLDSKNQYHLKLTDYNSEKYVGMVPAVVKSKVPPELNQKTIELLAGQAESPLYNSPQTAKALRNLDLSKLAKVTTFNQDAGDGVHVFLFNFETTDGKSGARFLAYPFGAFSCF